MLSRFFGFFSDWLNWAIQRKQGVDGNGVIYGKLIIQNLPDLFENLRKISVIVSLASLSLLFHNKTCIRPAMESVIVGNGIQICLVKLGDQLNPTFTPGSGSSHI